MATNQRNRIIYQSQALFISPYSSGYHIQSGTGSNTLNQGSTDIWNADNNTVATAGWTGVSNLSSGTSTNVIFRSLTIPLERIQSANFGFSINRTDVNEFSQLARLDSIVMESPTVSLDYSYYITDGANERKMGFNIPTTGARRGSATAYYDADDLCLSGYSALSGLMEDTQGNNYFILVGKEGKDIQGEPTAAWDGNNFDVVAIGNGFISDYSVEAAVGSIPTASVSVEAFNIQIDTGISGAAGTVLNTIPAVDIEDGSALTNKYFLQGYETGVVGDGRNASRNSDYQLNVSTGVLSALRPGDITFALRNEGDTANASAGIIDMTEDGEAHVQSFSLSVPMSRTVLGRLGNTFGYARVIDLPLTLDISVSIIMSEYEKNVNIFKQLCGSATKHTIKLTLYKCDPATGTTDTSKINGIQYIIKGARLESQSFSNSIGDNQTADLTFSCQVGGSNDRDNGLFMNGSYVLDPFRVIKSFPLGKNKDLSANANIGNPVAP